MTTEQQIQDQPIESIYPEIREAYHAHPEMEYWVKALDRVKRYFDIMSEGKPKTRRIDALYRVSGSGKEYLYWAETILSEDYMGNSITFDSGQGKVDVPKFHFEFIPEESKIMAVSVDRTETVYNTENTQENLSDLLADCTNNTNFYLDTGSRIYTISRDAFISDSFSDAEQFCRTGIRKQEK